MRVLRLHVVGGEALDDGLGHLAAGSPQKPLAPQIGCGNRVAFRQPVLATDEEVEALIVDWPAVQPIPRLWKRPGDSELNLAVLQQPVDFLGSPAA